MELNIGTTMRQYLEAKAGLPENPIVIFCEGDTCVIRFGDVPRAQVLGLPHTIEGVHEGVPVKSLRFPLSEFDWAQSILDDVGETISIQPGVGYWCVGLDGSRLKMLLEPVSVDPFDADRVLLRCAEPRMWDRTAWVRLTDRIC